MKKLIQIGAMFALLVSFTAVSAYAQKAFRYDAQIPFDFSVGQKSYKAGKYTIRVSNPFAATATVSIEDSEGNQFYTIHGLTSGEVSRNQPTLIFNRYENQNFLSKILVQEKGVTLPVSGAEKDLAGKSRKKKSKTQVAVAAPQR